MIIFIGAVLGAIGGSFLNAVSFRRGTGRSILFEHGPSTSLRASRSRCMRCGHTLSGLDLVPVLSWLMLGGRCRYCGTRISAQYPLVELAAAGLGALVAGQSPAPLSFAFWLVVWLVLLFTLVYDLRHYVIPWSCSGLMAALGLASVAWSLEFGALSFAPLSSQLIALSSGPLVAAPLLFLSLISRGRWMGWGDGALMLGVGWLLGLSLGYSALLIAFWLGALVGIALLALRRGYTMGSELPFAPFLIVGAGAAHFLHADIFTILSTIM